MSHQKLTSDELDEALELLPGWQHKDEKLQIELTFSNFVEAFGFMSKVALVAEEIGHHPEWSNVYNKLTIKLWTHENNGITEHDIQLANAIQTLINTK